MKLPLTLILLGSTLSAGAQTPIAPPHPMVQGQMVADLGSPDLGSPVLLLAADDDEDDSGWLSFGDDDSSGEDCDEDEEDCPTAGRGNAAPAGTVAPPANGLFGDGKAPTASTN